MADENSQIGFETTVDEVMRRSPATIRVFLDFRMNCVGCPIAGFHTVEDACREHGATRADFLSALRAAEAAYTARSVRRALSDAEQSVRVADGDALSSAFDEALLLPGA
jgi:hybrid cluster-associated redox disulfide protein